jgi:hypothetical protein
MAVVLTFDKDDSNKALDQARELIGKITD